MNIVLAGGTGFVGRALLAALAARGDKVALLSRDAAAARARWGTLASVSAWDGRTPGDWTRAVDGADAVVNLCGESVAGGRWTPARKLVLIRSRLGPTRALVAAIAAATRKPSVLVNASAVGYYGDGAEPAVESAVQGEGFLAALCGQWEREAATAAPLGVRVAIARLGVVLDRDGGALPRMAWPFRLFAGGPLGDGAQPFAWVHRADAVAGLLFLLDRADLSGPANLVAPAATTNAEFSAALGRALRRPSWLPAPEAALRLALGEMAGLLLGGRPVVPRALQRAGYAFRHPDADSALAAIYRR